MRAHFHASQRSLLVVGVAGHVLLSSHGPVGRELQLGWHPSPPRTALSPGRSCAVLLQGPLSLSEGPKSAIAGGDPQTLPLSLLSQLVKASPYQVLLRPLLASYESPYYRQAQPAGTGHRWP